MFCCDNNKNKMACYEGMIAGGIIVAASIFTIKIFKKMKCRKIEKNIQEFEIQERKLRDQEEYNKTSENDEDIELKEKVDEIDPAAFVIVTDAREVHGEGFIEKK